MRFESAHALNWIWFLIPLAGVIWFRLKQRRKRMQNVFKTEAFQFLTASVSRSKQRWKYVLQFLCLILMIVAYARPQKGKAIEDDKSEGIELMILFDVSNSMLAEDVKPSRLQLAKSEVMRFLNLASGDRVGLIAFAGSAAMSSPVTPDKSALKMFIESLGPEAVSTQGTEFRKALQEAFDAFQRGGVDRGEDTVLTRAILIVSDGEDNEPGALETAKALVKEGIHIFSMVVGTQKGGLIPVRDARGVLRGYRKDPSGQEIMTKTDGTVLRQLAKEGQGSFYHATFGGNAAKKVYEDILKLERAEFESAQVTSYDERFQWPLFFAFLIGLLELLMSERRPKPRLWRGRFQVGAR